MAIQKTVPFTLEVLAPADLFCEVSPVYLGVRQGHLAVFTLTVQSLNGFAGAVDVTVTGLSAPVTMSDTLASGGTVAFPITIDTTALAIQQYPLAATVDGTEA